MNLRKMLSRAGLLKVRYSDRDGISLSLQEGLSTLYRSVRHQVRRAIIFLPYRIDKSIDKTPWGRRKKVKRLCDRYFSVSEGTPDIITLLRSLTVEDAPYVKEYWEKFEKEIGFIPGADMLNYRRQLFMGALKNLKERIEQAQERGVVL